ncbi:MAG: phosphotransferase [Candidatus Endonucleobacter bathymodioli]|uniref:Phosphotransferase n=1 Tax=Candidatus Endonucleibacter bathymodioli TaxID=539814 RepID=A0AA90NL24_9GAMM|nr:phosphotransferase [Candidatus Endonucleobacter bathymodioli]
MLSKVRSAGYRFILQSPINKVGVSNYMVTGSFKQTRVILLEEERRNLLARWVAYELSAFDDFQSITPLKAISSDASFRKYYRVQGPAGPLIAVDAHPDKEDNETFINIAHQWRQQGVRVPEVHAFDQDNGFMLMEDFGDIQLHDCLLDERVDNFYNQAMELSKQIQLLPATGLPVYDKHLLRFELSLYPQWFLKSFLGLTLNDNEDQALNDLFDYLVESALEQPRVTIHRDFHSRNLMVCDDGKLGVLDFQGASHGPLLYDLVSLLKDCYHCWPTEKVEQWLQGFTQTLPQLASINMAQIQQWFDWIGLQRHLKCMGIFSRLWLRDKRTNYLDDLPVALDYIVATCKRYSELEHHAVWLEKKVVPKLSGRVNDIREGVGV